MSDHETQSQRTESEPEPQPEPILTGYVGRRLRGSTSDCVLAVWCSRCVVWHRHSIPCDVSPGTVTARVAHCYAGRNSHTAWYTASRRLAREAGRLHGYEGYAIKISGDPFEHVADSVREVNITQRNAIGEGRTTPGIEQLRAQVPRVLRRSSSHRTTAGTRTTLRRETAA